MKPNNIGNFRGKIHCLEKADIPIDLKRKKQDQLKNEFKKYEDQLSNDEIDWIKRVLYDEDIFLKKHSDDDFFNTLLNRRSIRIFGRGLTKEEIKLITEFGGLAPSSCNRQPLEMLVINDRQMISKIAKVKKQSFITGARTLLIPLANKNVYPKPNKKNISSFYYFLFSDMAVAVQNMLLVAEKTNLSMCWVNLATVKERNFINEFIHLPENLFPFCLLPCGEKIVKNVARPGRKDIKIIMEAENE